MSGEDENLKVTKDPLTAHDFNRGNSVELFFLEVQLFLFRFRGLGFALLLSGLVGRL